MARHPCRHPAWAAVPAPDTPGLPAAGPVAVRCLARLGGGRQSEYDYELVRGDAVLSLRVARRRRKTMAVYVEKGHATELRVPLNCPWYEVHGFLADRFDWILAAEREMAARPAVIIDECRPGGMISYLGQRYPLELVTSRTAVAELQGDRLMISCTDPLRETLVERKLHAWYRRRAESLYQRLIDELSLRFSDRRSPGSLVIRKMRSRWGSCSYQGEICLNLLLIREALPQIEFVIAHELCHLRHFGHNSAFYQLMDEVMPDWRAREARLGHAGRS